MAEWQYIIIRNGDIILIQIPSVTSSFSPCPSSSIFKVKKRKILLLVRYGYFAGPNPGATASLGLIKAYNSRFTAFSALLTPCRFLLKALSGK